MSSSINRMGKRDSTSAQEPAPKKESKINEKILSATKDIQLLTQLPTGSRKIRNTLTVSPTLHSKDSAPSLTEGRIVQGEDSEDDVPTPFSPEGLPKEFPNVQMSLPIKTPEDNALSPTEGRIVQGEDSEDDAQADEIAKLVCELNKPGFIEGKGNFKDPFIGRTETGLSRSIERDQNGQPWILFNREKKGDSLLGKGGSKKVKYALNPKTLEFRARSSAKQEDSVYAEVYAKKYGAHTPGIAKFYSVTNYVNKKGVPKTSILQEAYPTNLKDILNEVSYSDCLQITVDVLEGLQFMRAQGDRHGDIKPANIMCYEDEKGQLRAVLNDFDLTRNISDVSMTGGTDGYIAPEILYGIGSPSPGEFKNADIYSLGIVLRELFWNQPLSHKLKNCIDAMLSKDPDSRPNVSHLFTLFEGELIAVQKRAK